jgi:hypothetical protein
VNSIPKEASVKELSTLEQGMLYGVIATAIAGLLYALWLWRDTVRRDKGEPEDAGGVAGD